ncbi:ABC transporter ATP-binding protein [Pseudogemmobacter sonorensis]|uniref:ABC transporter ATP-binding protein n=1 Tax=Pseudogemmobacter sonorensis TaxID=2989681 RepID=UPI0036BFADD2
MNAGLEIGDATVRYGRKVVLDRFSLPILPPGQVTVLAGPNAAGKSTLLRGIARLAPVQGRFLLDGADLSRMSAPERAGRIGFMPQALPLGASLSVLESTITALRAGGAHHGPDAAAQAMAVLDRLGIGALATEPLDRLSGGQRQMVGLAQATVRDPRLLLLDEPTSALDLARQVRLLSEVRRIASEGRVVLAVLHDLALAARWADRIAVLHRGRIHSEGPPETVVTPAMLAEVYGVEARVEHCSQGRLTVLIDRELQAAP